MPAGGLVPLVILATFRQLELLPRLTSKAARPASSPAKVFEKIGEPVGIRTRDPLIKSQMLYRLSYGLSPTEART